MQKSLLITTLDPINVGGITTVCDHFLEWIRSSLKFKVELAFSSLRRPDEVNVTSSSVFSGNFLPTIQTESVNGNYVYRVGTAFPRIESLRYMFNLNLWSSLLSKFDFHAIISGYALDAYAHAILNIPYVLFVASDLVSERAPNLIGRNLFIHSLTRIQMGRLLAMEKLALKKASWVFTCSPWVLERLRNIGANASTSSVINIPIDHKIWYPNPQSCRQPQTIVWAGRLSDPRKNTVLLLHVFYNILKRIPDARLNLIGPLQNDTLIKKSRLMGLTDQVCWHGEVSQIKQLHLLQSASVFVIPSYQEGLCISGLEAMACGLPIISTRCGGPEYFVFPNKNGYLVDNETQMEDAIVELLLNDSLRRSLGASGSDWIRETFNYTQFSKALTHGFSHAFSVSAI